MTVYGNYASMTDWNEIAHLPEISEIAEILRRQLNLWVGIATPSGIAAYAGEQQAVSKPLCEAFMANHGNCRDSYIAWYQEAAHARGPVLVRCHAGLRGMAAPIFLNDRCEAAVFASGFIEPGDEEDIFERSHTHAQSQSTLSNSVNRLEPMTPREKRLALELLSAVARYAQKALSSDNALTPVSGFDRFAGPSALSQSIRTQLSLAAHHALPVLLSGPSGSGKSLAAELIHSNSERRNEAFIVQSCVSESDTAFLSELFGHRRGAFPGALCDMPGLIELAHGGTLVLDDIDALSPNLQKRVLKLAEDGTYLPLGDPIPRHVDIRLIAASRLSLDELTRSDAFDRALVDRFQRLVCPPLASHAEDIQQIASLYLHTQGVHASLSDELVHALTTYAWPGNVRELQSELERLAILNKNSPVLTADFVSERIRIAAQTTPPTDAAPHITATPFTNLAQWLDELERNMILHVLEQNQFNRTRAADVLGISRRNLIRKIERFEIETPSDDSTPS